MGKGKYERWLTPEGLTLLAGWARDGLTDEQIAKKMGICRDTLYEYKRKFSDISDTLSKNKEIIDYQVESALLSSALKGNTYAQTYWLNNRRPDKWRSNPTNENNEALDKLDAILKEVKQNAVLSETE